jgi:hypothetical protein
MSKYLLFPLLFLALIISACSPAMATQSPSVGMGAPSTAPSAGESRDSFSKSNTIADSTSQGQQVDRLVIKNANLSIAVLDPAATMATISQMADQMHGFVVSSNLFKSTSRSGIELPEANITIRVPAPQLDEALRQIKALVPDKETDILSENVTGQDVTKEYTDLQSRLTNLENTEKQLQKIMDEASKTEDVLTVYNQLVSVREQIEVFKGQIKYYEESAALSMIAVTIQSKAAVEPLSIGGWKPIGVARNALQATLEGVKFLVNAAIWIVLFFLPIGLIIALPIVVIVLIIRRGRKNRKTATQTTPPVPPSNQA